MQKPELVEVLARLGAAYQRQIGDDQLRLWWEVVGDFDGGEAREATGWFVRNEEQMPTPARFRSRVLGERRAARSAVAEERGLPDDTLGPLTPPEEALPRLRQIREALMEGQRLP